jgi:hypothetical protein
MNIKVSELFYSVQGEGRFMGVPSIFLRTYGCNFTCQGFGMPRGELSHEAEKLPNVPLNLLNINHCRWSVQVAIAMPVGILLLKISAQW